MLRAFATVVLFNSTLISSAMLASTARADVKDFPYQAKVVAAETYVRSGAGDDYYPTQALSRDAVVTVVRHDPGGWYMIEPPAGSFSWIPERYVKRLSDTEGEVSDESIPAFVGSEFGDESSLFQRRLKTGEKVAILGQKKIDTTSGMQSMLKIAPPRREWRWIPGAAVVPVDERLRQKQNSDPYKVPGNAKRPEGAIVTPQQAIELQTAMNGDGVADVPPIGPSSQLSHLQQLRREQQQLAEIDRRFRDMILRDASQWDLDSVENEYRSLQRSSTHKPVAGQIDMRYPAIERYRRRLATLIELKQLTSQTEMTDAQLLARHSSTSGLAPSVIASAGPESMMSAGQPPLLADAFESFLNRDISNIASSQQPANADGTILNPQISADSTPGTESFPGGVISPGSPQNRFVGAGIVQKIADGGDGTGYVLMTPSGKILADLKPTGNVSLEEFVGQQVGVQGSRWSEEEKRDMIEVIALEAVRIRQ